MKDFQTLRVHLVYPFSIFIFSEDRNYTENMFGRILKKIFLERGVNLKTLISSFQCFLLYLLETFSIENAVAQW